jgi:hypothetical protein
MSVTLSEKYLSELQGVAEAAAEIYAWCSLAYYFGGEETPSPLTNEQWDIFVDWLRSHRNIFAIAELDGMEHTLPETGSSTYAFAEMLRPSFSDREIKDGCRDIAKLKYYDRVMDWKGTV